MAKQPNPPIDLDDMITHDELLERYTWLSTKILGRWRRQGAIRVFGGRGGMRVYSKSDIARAITADMDASIQQPHSEERQATVTPLPPNGQTEMSEADQIRERLFLRTLASRRRK